MVKGLAWTCSRAPNGVVYLKLKVRPAYTPSAYKKKHTVGWKPEADDEDRQKNE